MCTALAVSAQDTAVNATANAASPAYSTAAHDALIAARREGRATPGEVLDRLHVWLAQSPASNPARARLASDAVVLAVDLDRRCDAVAFGRTIAADQVADYALAPLVSAARHCGDNALQAAVLQVWLNRMPTAREPLRQTAFWHLDTGDVAGAQRLYDQLAMPAPTETAERMALMELQAALALARQQRTVALGVYQQMLVLVPEHRDARKQTVLLLGEAGGASAAWQQARATQDSHPGTFAPLELARLQQAALGEQLGWAVGERDLRLGPERTRPLDEVLAQLQAADREAEVRVQQGGVDAADWQGVRNRLRWDQVLGQVERGNPAASLALYRQLQREGVPAPFHGQAAAARAMARLGQSHEAVDLYVMALREEDEDSTETRNAQIGLIYAYADAGRFHESDALLDRLKARTPAYLRLAPIEQTPNPEYTALHVVEADIMLMGDRLDAAQTRFATLSGEAALHAGFRAGSATVSQRRDHPEQALQEFEALLTDDPQGIHTRAGYADALMGANEWRAAREQVQALAADAGDEAVVTRLQAHHRAAVAPRLDIDAGGESGNLGLAQRIWRVDSRLSSALLNDAWRVHTGYTRAQGDTDADGYRVWHRGAAGLSWTQGRWEAQAQLQHANFGPYRDSVGAGLAYRLSDRWRLAARYDGDSPETPWRARNAGIGARSLELEARWVHSERRTLDLALSRMNFSDGNARDGARVQWTERWISWPRVQVETRLSAGNGEFKLQQRPYFSPERETGVQGSVWFQWLTWRNYESIFFQGVELTAGNYRQSGFGGGALWSARYEHRWQLGPQAQLRYGVSFGSQPYDGRQEKQRRVYLQLSVPLQ